MKIFTDIYTESNTTATFTIGYQTIVGKLIVTSKYTDDQGSVRSYGSFAYNGADGVLTIGDKQLGLPGKIIMGRVSTTSQGILLDAQSNSITLGGTNAGGGGVTIKNRMSKDTIKIDGEAASITVGSLGTNSQTSNGEIIIKNTSGTDTIKLYGSTGNIVLGGGDQDGDISIKDGADVETIHLSGSSGSITLGGGQANGDITIKSAVGNSTMIFDGGNATIIVGGIGANGDVIVKNDNDIDTIKITGSNGDIEFLNADVAEEFDISDAEIDLIIPGSVMKLGPDGKLTLCDTDYDTKVVGIIAGAGNYKPGIVMDKKGGLHRRPLAIMGKVYCLVDASNGPVEIGDMLTTSSEKGFAMKVTENEKAFGAVIGKSLGELTSGKGLIPVLVNLQ